MDRGDIESREAFVKRNIAWWRKNEDSERKTRKAYYQEFWDRRDILRFCRPDMVVGEVGPGPFGGILEVLGVKAQKKVFIDYIMEELRDLHFIKWPDNSLFVNDPFEKVQLADRYCDLLLSYNALDHGWSVKDGLRECLRISKVCVLSFDCRADDLRQLDKVDMDHFTKVGIHQASTWVFEIAESYHKLCEVYYVKKKRANGKYKTFWTMEVVARDA